jgi:hypothetical protein
MNNVWRAPMKSYHIGWPIRKLALFISLLMMAAIYKRVQPDRILSTVWCIYNTFNSDHCEYRFVPLNLTPIDLLRRYQYFLSGIFHWYTKHILSCHLRAQPYLLLLKLSSTKKSSILNLIGHKLFMHIHVNRKTLRICSHGLNGRLTEWKPMGSDDGWILAFC